MCVSSLGRCYIFIIVSLCYYVFVGLNVSIREHTDVEEYRRLSEPLKDQKSPEIPVLVPFYVIPLQQLEFLPVPFSHPRSAAIS